MSLNAWSITLNGHGSCVGHSVQLAHVCGSRNLNPLYYLCSDHRLYVFVSREWPHRVIRIGRLFFPFRTIMTKSRMAVIGRSSHLYYSSTHTEIPKTVKPTPSPRLRCFCLYFTITRKTFQTVIYSGIISMMKNLSWKSIMIKFFPTEPTTLT